MDFHRAVDSGLLAKITKMRFQSLLKNEALELALAFVHRRVESQAHGGARDLLRQQKHSIASSQAFLFSSGRVGTIPHVIGGLIDTFAMRKC